MAILLSKNVFIRMFLSKLVFIFIWHYFKTFSEGFRWKSSIKEWYLKTFYRYKIYKTSMTLMECTLFILPSLSPCLHRHFNLLFADNATTAVVFSEK